MQVAVVLSGRAANYSIEGPTQAQARKMAAYRQAVLAKSAAALAAGDDERAFDLDCEAMDVEVNLNRYGFNLNTGRRAR